MDTPPINEEDIFQVAAALQDDERVVYLDAACGDDLALRERIKRLVGSHKEGGFMEGPAVQQNPDIEEVIKALKPEEVGERIGSYKLLQEIGSGGFGTVWMADQVKPVKRRVALKVIKMGMDTKEVVARFEQERQALAMMDHPNIAKVFDAGATRYGRPYFVMELVRGKPITEYCDERKLSVRERLALFIDVCSALQHAHQKGIIHRDIKPTNILVAAGDGDMPMPKIIDFGVAKAMDRAPVEQTLFTQFGEMIGTPAYMSPEQAGAGPMDIDTRSDIYSLGVVLYEMLAGKPPFDPEELRLAGYEEMRRVIREQEPPRPSTRLSTLQGMDLTGVAAGRHIEPAKLAATVRGDLDWIVMKALEKDRRRRYETATQLSMDIQRHLANETVIARPPTAAYRLGRLIRRNRLAVSAGCAVAASLVIGAGVSRWQALRAMSERDFKEQALQKAHSAEADTRAFSEFLVKRILAAARPADLEGGLGIHVTVVNALEQAVKQLENDFTNRPRAEAVAREAIGVTWETLSRYDEAASQLLQAVKLRGGTNSNDPATLKTLNDLAVVYQSAGMPEKALTFYEMVLQKRKTVLSVNDADIVLGMNNLAGAYFDMGDVERASTLYEETFDAAKASLRSDDPNRLKIMNNLARVWAATGTTDPARALKALPLYKDAFEASRTKLTENHPITLTCMNNLAVCYEQAGQLPVALPLYEQCLKLSRTILGEDHLETLIAMSNLAGAYFHSGELPRAIALYEEALAKSRSKLGHRHRDTVHNIVGLAVSYEAAREPKKAIPLYVEALEIRKSDLVPNHRLTLKAVNNLAVAYTQTGDMGNALPLCTEAFEGREKLLGPKDPDTLKSMFNLALAFRKNGGLQQSAKLFQALINILDGLPALGEGYPAKPDVERRLAEVREELRKMEHIPETPTPGTDKKPR